MASDYLEPAYSNQINVFRPPQVVLLFKSVTSARRGRWDAAAVTMLHHLSHEYADSSGLVRAAQYLRMSSDHQRYSTESQQNAIGEYARQHGYEVVATYIDAGKSGLSLKGRGALKQLLSDALASQRSFDAVLVLDVSRWGRFQNPDEAAHYEFLCREAGVRVVYCAEPFGEDVAPITTIIKHLKRVMAGEYSRELSAKLCRAHLQQAQLGFRQGGTLIYGFRRLLVDPARNPRQVLNDGQRKALNTDKVIVIPGPPEELAVIRRVFRLYVRDHLTIPEIVSWLANEGIKGFGDKPLGRSTVRHILSNELCIGRMTYNRTTKRLQGPTLKNPEELWTRFTAFEPIVPMSQFRKAQELLRWRSRPWDKETIINSLRDLLAKEGRLTQHLINKAPGVPSSEAVVNHFGSLHEAYALVGYKPTLRPFGANGRHWSKKTVLSGLQKLYETHGYVSTLLIDTSPNLPSQGYIRRNFGSIPEAMRQAGLPVLSHSENQRRSWNRRKAAGCDKYYHGVHWTDAKLLRAVQQLYKQYGFISGALLDQNGDTPTAYYFIKRFGSLTKTWILAKLPAQTHSQRKFAAWKRKKEGGIVPRQPRYPGYRHPVRYRSEDMLHGLRRLAAREGAVSATRIDVDTKLPSGATVAHRFGSLCAAYQLAGLVRLPGKGVRYGLPPCDNRSPRTPSQETSRRQRLRRDHRCA